MSLKSPMVGRRVTAGLQVEVQQGKAGGDLRDFEAAFHAVTGWALTEDSRLRDV